MIKLSDLNTLQGKKGVIYLITNKFNHRRFIGVSEEDILSEFESTLESEEGQFLSRAIKKYSKSSFIIEILEENQPKFKLKGLKNYYILKYKTLFIDGLGYNILIKEEENQPKIKEFKHKYYVIKENTTKFYEKYADIASDLGISTVTVKDIFNGVLKNLKADEMGRIIDGELVKAEFIEEKSLKSKSYQKDGMKRFNEKKKENVKKHNLEVIKNTDLSKWIDKELIKEDKIKLVEELQLKNTGVSCGWNTVKKYLKLSGYDIIDKNIMICGERIQTSRIVKV